VRALFAGLMCGLLLASSVARPRSRRSSNNPVQFKKGEKRRHDQGQPEGRPDHRLHAARQRWPGHGGAVQTHQTRRPTFNVMAPVATKPSSSALLPATSSAATSRPCGVYTIRVYLMRNAESATRPVSYTLDVGSDPVPSRASAPQAAASAATIWAREVGCVLQWSSARPEATSVRQAVWIRVVRDLAEGRAASIWIGNVAMAKHGYPPALRRTEVLHTNDSSSSLGSARTQLVVERKRQGVLFIPDALIHGG